MKTLKTLFLFLVLVCAGNSFGQTKEETIEWLIVNGKPLCEMRCEDVKHNQVTTFFLSEVTTDTLKFWIGNTVFPRVIYVAIKDILFEDVNKLQKSGGNGECNMFLINLAKEAKYIEIPLLENGKENFKEKELRSGRIPFFFENEENAKRVIKAIMHLAKLSGAKENKQTF